MAVQAQHLAHAFHHDYSRAIRFVTTTAHARSIIYPCLAAIDSSLARVVSRSRPALDDDAAALFLGG